MVDIVGKYNYFMLAEYLRTYGVFLGVETLDEELYYKSGNDVKVDFGCDDYVVLLMVLLIVFLLEVEFGGGARGGEFEFFTSD